MNRFRPFELIHENESNFKSNHFDIDTLCNFITPAESLQIYWEFSTRASYLYITTVVLEIGCPQPDFFVCRCGAKPETGANVVVFSIKNCIYPPSCMWVCNKPQSEDKTLERLKMLKTYN